jgi:hypothetical protein
LDQDRIAGIGNVYVQTLPWRAKIRPLRPIPSPIELNLYGQEGGWDDPYLFDGEERAPRPVCGTPLAKIRTRSRGGHIRPGCQRLEPAAPLG